MTKKEKLEVLAKKLFPNGYIHYGRSEMCCAIPDTGEVPWGYTLHPGTGWQRDIKYLGRTFAEAEATLQRETDDMHSREWLMGDVE